MSNQFTRSSTCERSPELAVHAELHEEMPEDDAEEGAEESDEGWTEVARTEPTRLWVGVARGGAIRIGVWRSIRWCGQSVGAANVADMLVAIYKNKLNIKQQ